MWGFFQPSGFQHVCSTCNCMVTICIGQVWLGRGRQSWKLILYCVKMLPWSFLEHLKLQDIPDILKNPVDSDATQSSWKIVFNTTLYHERIKTPGIFEGLRDLLLLNNLLKIEITLFLQVSTMVVLIPLFGCYFYCRRKD